MAFEFDTNVPQNTRIPGTYLGYDATNALQGINVSEKVCCFVGEMRDYPETDGKAEKNKVHKISTEKQAIDLFGENSNLHLQIRAAFAVVMGVKYVALAADKSTDDEIDFEGCFEVLKSHKFDIISFPYEVNGTVGGLSPNSAKSLKAYLELASNPIEQRPAIAVSGYVGDLIDEQDKLPSANNPRIVFVNARDLVQTLPEMVGAVAAMILSKSDPAKPFDNFTLPLNANTNYLRNETETLLREGVTPLDQNADATLSVVRLISTETDGVSEKLPDLWIRSLDFIREAVRADVKKCFTDEKLTTNALDRIRSVIFGTLKKLESAEIIKNVDKHKDNLIVEPNPDNIGFLTCRIPCDIVVGLHGMTGFIDLIIS